MRIPSPAFLFRLHPTSLILISFLAAIACGTCLLQLPCAVRGAALSWLDTLFTATSAVCVTGLAVVDTGTRFSPFGQAVLLLLVQVGALGVMTISVMVFSMMGKGVSLKNRMVMQGIFAPTPRNDIFSLVKSVFLFTALAELAGTLLLAWHWRQVFPWPELLFNALFHAVSAFCNAGFALFPDNLVAFRDDMLLNMVIGLLIVLGGIGFPVLYELGNRICGRTQRIGLQSKTALLTSAALIVLGTLLLWLIESHHARQSAPGFLPALFQSISCRTAGYNTVDIGALHPASLAVMLFLMFFGASPGSCGGGVKTTTLAILLGFVAARLRRQQQVNLFRRTIPQETVALSISLTLLALTLIATVFFMLLLGDALAGHIAERHQGAFLDLLFETVSAFGTVGLSTGITPELVPWEKGWIIVMMILGRLGVLTFALGILGQEPTRGVEYAEETMMIG